ncbi:5-oxoprolinase subunit PxpA [Microbulbifer magnicolonia]|uniref:5-oxoprolinase subunit PxpA n=1 Tax=Microbulbifer magnicolonia TaxID=3109744 RepID=UPI002B417D4A|nr:5-oxoprolinase subunit PxpA [Microbulbifer sp. GG15]
MQTIDINCDLGEGKTAADCARDAQIMPYISRCNIACGGHAGNLTTMQLSVANARRNGLLVGAHPGYPDPDNFGRVSLKIELGSLLESIWEQVNRLRDVAGEAAVRLDHIKLHGALYNDAEADRALAERLVGFLAEEFPALKIMGLANGEMEAAARRHRQPFIREGFMDRRYLNDHQLAPRSMEGAVISELDLCLAQALCLAQGRPFESCSGAPLQFSVDSICVHGDNPNAAAIAQRLLLHFQSQGIAVRR